MFTAKSPPVKRLTELSTEEEEFSAQNVKPAPFDMPPDTGKTVAEAIGFMKNGTISKEQTA